MEFGASLFNLAFLVTLDVKDLGLDVVERVGCYSQNYSGSTGPVSVEADSEISCFSDGAGRVRLGLCTPTARRQPQLIIYETFNVPAMYVVIQAVLSLYASDG